MSSIGRMNALFARVHLFMLPLALNVSFRCGTTGSRGNDE